MEFGLSIKHLIKKIVNVVGSSPHNKYSSSLTHCCQRTITEMLIVLFIQLPITFEYVFLLYIVFTCN